MTFWRADGKDKGQVVQRRTERAVEAALRRAGMEPGKAGVCVCKDERVK